MEDVINKLLIYSKLSAKGFAEKIGLDRPQAIYDILNGKTKGISRAMENKILSVFPEVNKTWLLTGEGEMLRSSISQTSSGNNNTQVVGDGNRLVNTALLEEVAAQRRLTEDALKSLARTQEQVSSLIELLKEKKNV